MSERHGFTITPLTRVTARLVAHDWAWACENADAIDRNWERRRAERPGLFDGIVLLACGCAIRDGTCTIAFFETRFSRFIAFRDAGSPDPGVHNAFAAIVPVSADGAVLLGKMGGHTANAGQVYFPCGTPDRDDVRESGHIDLAGSAARELAEETGLSVPLDESLGKVRPSSHPRPHPESEGWRAGDWLLLSGQGQLAFLRPVAFADRAETLRERIETYCRWQDAPELAEIVIARGKDNIDSRHMPGFVQAFLEGFFRD